MLFIENLLFWTTIDKLFNFANLFVSNVIIYVMYLIILYINGSFVVKLTDSHALHILLVVVLLIEIKHGKEKSDCIYIFVNWVDNQVTIFKHPWTLWVWFILAINVYILCLICCSALDKRLHIILRLRRHVAESKTKRNLNSSNVVDMGLLQKLFL